MPEKIVFVLGFVVLLAAGFYLFPNTVQGEVKQPIAYSHRVHLAKNITCTVCHQGAETAVQATLPGPQTCNMCHQAPITKNPEAEKFKQYLDVGEIPWVRVFKLRDDVHFAHDVHARQKVTCQTCHGDMSQVDTPERGFGSQGGGGPYGLQLMNGLCLDCHTRPAPANSEPKPPKDGQAASHGQSVRSTWGPSDCMACHK